MISVTELRSGTVFSMDGQPWVVLKYEHIKMGRGSAQIKVKVRGLKSGSVVEKMFQNGAKVDDLTTLKRPLQYLYRDGENYVFMDPKSFEQISLTGEMVGDQSVYLKEGVMINVAFLEEDGEMTPLSLELPMKMEFSVAETDPGVKGDSAVNIFKSAKLDNGLTVKVPLFVEVGERVIIDTRTGEYMSRGVVSKA